MYEAVVLKNYANGEFVAIDQNSGGYPHEVSTPFRAHIWRTEEEALKYARMFDNKYGLAYLTVSVSNVKS